MAGQADSFPPKASACIARSWSFSETFPTHRCLAYTGFMSGLTLGMALARIDPEWAREAYDELSAQEAAVWGSAGASAQVKRLQVWKEAQQLIQSSERRRLCRGGEM